MFWYGLVMLFVGGSFFSYLVDGRSGFGSTLLVESVNKTDTAIAVKSLTGFVPDKYGETTYALDEAQQLMIGGVETAAYQNIVYPNTQSVGCTTGGRTIPAPCIYLSRSDAVEHSEGEHAYNANSAALNEFVGFRVGQKSTSFGILTFPFQAAGAIGTFIAKVLLWDWSYLEGNAVYIKWFLLYPLSAAVIVALLKLFTDAASIFSL